jgi:hypothetical protein
MKTKKDDLRIVPMCHQVAGRSYYKEYNNFNPETATIHIMQNVCAGNNSPTTYDCAEYVVVDDEKQLWRVNSGFYVKAIKGYLILDGPQGTKNKYLTPQYERNWAVSCSSSVLLGIDLSGLHPESLGKFSHSGLFLTEFEALRHANEIIARHQAELREIEHYHLARMRELNPNRLSGTFF